MKKKEMQTEIAALRARVAELEAEILSLKLQKAVQPIVIPQPDTVKPWPPPKPPWSDYTWISVSDGTDTIAILSPGVS